MEAKTDVDDAPVHAVVMLRCDNCHCKFPKDHKGGKTGTQTICCVHCAFHPLGCRCRHGEWGQPETQIDGDWSETFDEFDDDMDPVGSCDDCGVNIYAEENDGSGLCDQCQWYIAQANGQST